MGAVPAQLYQQLTSANAVNKAYYTPDDHGGLNYYLNGVPITNTRYAQETGQNTNDLEKQTYQSFLGGQKQPSTSGFSSSSASSSPSTDLNAAYGYDNQANGYQNQINQLDGSQNTALSNLQNQYNSNYNTAQDQFAKATRDYNTSVANNTNQFLTTKNGINTQTRTNANALQRLLGAAGAGNSSAALEQAPYAAALQGTQNLNQAQTTYASNQAGLDTNYGDTRDNYKKALDDLQQQLYQNQNAAKSSIAQQRANLLNSLSQAKINAGISRGQTYAQAQAANNYDGQINDLLGQITSYGNNYASPIALKGNVSYTAPTAQDYSLGRDAVASNNQGGAASDINPAFLSLLTQRDKYGNLIGA